MLRYALRRAMVGLLVVWFVSIVIFWMIRLAPGDPATQFVGVQGTAEQRQHLLHDWGLDQPLYIQYYKWLEHALRGDFGQLLGSRQTVASIVWPRVAVSLTLTLAATFIALVTGVTAGTLAAIYRGSFLDRALTLIATVGITLPSYVFALLLILMFSLKNQFFPAVGWVNLWTSPLQSLKHMALPALVLGLGGAAVLSRFTRSAMLDVLGEDYIRTARAKGLRGSTVITRHAFRNAAIAPLTALGLLMGATLGGSVIIEQIFVIPGMGTAFITAIGARDYPTIQLLVLLYAVFFVFTNIVVDLLYPVLDPRISMAS